MNQENFVYVLYHNKGKNVEDVLDKTKSTEDFEILVSVEETGCRGNIPISHRRTTVSIKIRSDYSFEQLDREIKQNFIEVWFKH